MEPDEKRRRGGSWSKDTLLVQFTAVMLPPDSPEFQERAKRPLSERGPNLARYIEEAKAAREQPPPENG